MNDYDIYEKYEDILLKKKQKSGKGKVSCYSSKHVRIQQSKSCKK